MNLKTFVKNWSLVTIDGFQVLYGVVVSDSTRRYQENDYVCTSRIIELKNNVVTTKSGSVYMLIGDGTEYKASYLQLIELMSGISPSDLNLELK
ncbi:hypothetical protein ABIS04_13390 [Shewanella sp. H8]|uniref:DUF6957 family protein n=1 Tax=Shewanella sp. H8 TaxID=3342676 RepID=UPI0033152EA7